MFALLVCLLAITTWQLPPVYQMSSTNETLVIPLPVFTTAGISSNIDNITGVSYNLAGNQTYNLTNSEIIETIQHLGDLAYQASGEQGAFLFYLSQNISADYDGHIIYDGQQVNQDARTLILYNVYSANQSIQFNVAAPTYNITTDQISINIISSLDFQFSNQTLMSDILNCSKVKMDYLGANNFSYNCQNGSYYAIWNIPTFNAQGVVPSYDTNIVDNNTLNISKQLIIQQTLINPAIDYGTPNEQLLWSIIINSNNTVYICNIVVYNFQNKTEYICDPISQVEGQFINVMWMIGGFFLPELYIQTSTSLYILETNGPQIVMDLNNSDYVFVTTEYIYVQTIGDSGTNLSIYDKFTLLQVGQCTLQNTVFVVGNDVIITANDGIVSFTQFQPTFMEISPVAAQQLNSSQNISITISTPYYSTPYIYNITLFVVPINQTFFTVVNSPNPFCLTDTFTSYTSSTVIDLNQCFSILGPLVDIDVTVDASLNATAQIFQGAIQVFPMHINSTIQSVYYYNQMVTMNSLSGIQTINLRNNQTVSKSYNRSDFLKVYAFEKSMYGVTNQSVVKCDKTGNLCQDLFKLKNTASLNARMEMLLRKDKLYLSVADGQQLQLYVSKGNQLRVFNATEDIPPANQIISISLSQVNRGRVVVLCINNTVSVLTAAFNGTTSNLTLAYNLTLNCSTNNSVSQMQLQPVYNIMIVYCFNMPYLWEYILTNAQPTFQRIIPLYNFVTSSIGNFTNTFDFYMVPATLVQPLVPYVVGSNYTLIMKFGTNTVSSLHSIINTTFLIPVNHLNTILYESSPGFLTLQQLSTQALMLAKIQTEGDCLSKDSGQVWVGASSPFNYNFIQNLTFVFNLTEAHITVIGQSSQILFQQVNSHGNYTVDTDEQLYYGEYFLSLDNLNSILQDFEVTNTSDTLGMLPLTIHEVDLVQPNKLIGSVGDVFTSIISLNEVDYPILQGTTLLNIIIAITKKELVIMEKIGSGNVDLNVLQSFDITQPLNGYIAEYCRLNLYQVLNQTTAEFILFCGITQMVGDSFPYIITTVNYNQGQWLYVSFNNSVYLPELLVAISVVPTNGSSSPYVVGVQPQSGNTATSVFMIENTTNSATLAVSQQRASEVMIDFDVQQSNNSFVIVCMDLVSLNFWFNPYPNNNMILPTFSIPLSTLQNLTGQSQFSAIDIISLSNTTLQLFLSAYHNYFTISFNIVNWTATNLQVLNSFQKYYECNGYDDLNPEYAFMTGSSVYQPTIIGMVIYCTHNRTILEYVSSKNISNNQSIYTSYVQIYYARNNTINKPLRVLSSDATEVGCVLAVYNGQNATVSEEALPNTTASNITNLKMIYQQIEGVLVDNRLNKYLGFVVLSALPQLPNFQITLSNSYFSTSFVVNSKVAFPKPTFNKLYLPYLIFFILYNIITVVIFVIWCFKNTKKEVPADALLDPKSEDDEELKAYFDRLHSRQTKNRAREGKGAAEGNEVELQNFD